MVKKLKNNNKSKNNDGKCFQYAVTVALNYQNIKHNPERISKTKPFINQYNWEDIDFSSHKKDLKKFELDNKSIALYVLYVPYNTEEMRNECESKCNLKRENEVILLIIIDG